MSGQVWQLTAIVAALVVGVAFGVGAMLLRRNKDIAAQREGGWDRPALSIEPIIRLSFEESLDPQRFAKVVEEATREYSTSVAGPRLATGTGVTLQAVDALLKRGEMVVRASARGRTAVRAGNAAHTVHNESGRLTPFLRDIRSGKITEIMKAAGSGRKALSLAASASGIAVSAAYLLVCADIARQLNVIGGKLDQVLAFRKADQKAKLERIYSSARELLLSSRPHSEQRMELWRLRGELHELRAVWRNELEYHLRSIDNVAERGWFDRQTTITGWYDKGVVRKMSEGAAQIMELEYSLRLDRVLAVASGTWEDSKQTFRAELDAIARTRALLAERMGFISNDRSRREARRYADSLHWIIDNYGRLLEIGVRDVKGLPTGTNVGVFSGPEHDNF